MDNKDRLTELAEHMDNAEFAQSVANWLGENECGEFLTNYFNIDIDEDEEDETEEEEAYRESLNS